MDWLQGGNLEMKEIAGVDVTTAWKVSRTRKGKGGVQMRDKIASPYTRRDASTLILGSAPTNGGAEGLGRLRDGHDVETWSRGAVDLPAGSL
jgi:hypothetical protein